MDITINMDDELNFRVWRTNLPAGWQRKWISIFATLVSRTTGAKKMLSHCLWQMTFIPTCLIDKESCSLIEQSKTYTGQANLRASCPKRGQEFNFLLAPRHQFTMYWKPLPFILLHCFTLSKTFLFLGFFFLIILIYKTNSPIERIFSAWSD